ncbi:TrbG/VirB9 family P-type conjugative transfer protein [Vibrio scophthalmi]|uniref:Uncharacterized protein n=1 Tax=Vibrio scophthalmi TaxID=45658 RepID=A0A1E3WIT7_9VIBR|nr:TrbG/VirB9 family P-type conjugative transfer protein [Vibrio scophthalmi]ODS09650.1 hypothetical protein VSF3289_03314 [Vibrio scophthalmi]
MMLNLKPTMNRKPLIMLGTSLLLAPLSLNAHAVTKFSENPLDQTNNHMHNYTTDTNQPVSDHSKVIVPYLPVKSLNMTQRAFDHSKPKDNTIVFDYSELVTYKLRLREFMSSIVVFPENEIVEDYLLGDVTQFSVKPYANNKRMISIRPQMPGADTSLHVFGQSGNVYTFYLRTDTVESREHPILKAIIKDPTISIEREESGFVQLHGKETALDVVPAFDETVTTTDENQPTKDKEESVVKAFVADEQDDKEFLEKANPSQFNFGYEFVGSSDLPWYKNLFASEYTSSEELRPTYVYDDGVFTYFTFTNGNNTDELRNLPTIYRVMDGSDVPTNATAFNTTLRVEGVNNNWTLRLGKAHLCLSRIKPLAQRETNMATQPKEVVNVQ